MSLRVGVGYTDSRLTDDLEFVGGASGSSAPFIPRWTLTGSVDYTREIGRDLEAFAFLNVQHQGARNTRFDTAAADTIGRAHVCTPVTHAHLVCRLLLDK